MVEVQVRNPVFTKHDDGTITVDGWPERVRIHNDLLTTEHPGVSVVRDYIEFTVANGTAKYKVVERDPTSVICELWGCTWQAPETAEVASATT